VKGKEVAQITWQKRTKGSGKNSIINPKKLKFLAD